MLSRRQIQKFGALCDDDLAYLEGQVDLLLAIRRQPLVASSLRLVYPHHAGHPRVTPPFLKPQPLKVERRAQGDRRRHAGQRSY